MEMILTMIEYGGAKEDDDGYRSALDLLFEALEEEQPDHIAVREYHIFKQAAGKTARSILVSAAVRLSVFTLRDVQNITARDTLELEKLGDRKQAVFCVIPDSNDNSLNFLVGMLYTQAFQELYYQADKVYGGSLPVPVRLMFDEFANVALPDGYARLQATMRSRNIMATIILQNISQLKALSKTTGRASSATRTASSTWEGMRRSLTSTSLSCWGRKPSRPGPPARAGPERLLQPEYSTDRQRAYDPGRGAAAGQQQGHRPDPGREAGH